MKKLYFLAADESGLHAAMQYASEPLAGIWRWRLLTNRPVRSVAAVPPLGDVARSDLLGALWRGAFWALALSLLLLTALWPFAHEWSPLLRVVMFYGLPLSLVFFGAWLGGLLGLMVSNPVYAQCQPYLARGQQVLVVDCRARHERLLRRQMARFGLSLLGSRQRYFGSYRYPQNPSPDRLSR